MGKNHRKREFLFNAPLKDIFRITDKVKDFQVQNSIKSDIFYRLIVKYRAPN